MKRLAITLEDFDDSQVIRSTTIQENEVGVLESALSRANVFFEIENCEGPLYDYHLETERGEVDLGLRTIEEIHLLEAERPFHDSVFRFLNSSKELLHLEDAFRTLTLKKRDIS